MRLLVLLIPVLFANTFVASATELQGRVLDEDGQPLNTARVLMYSGSKPVNSLPYPVDLKGEFSIHVDEKSYDHVTLNVTADGYESYRLTVALNPTPARLELRLKPKPSIKLRDLQCEVVRAPSSLACDVLLVNSFDSSIVLTSFTWEALSRAQENCLDITPAVEARVVSGGKAIVISTPDGKWHEEKSLDGTFEALPCGIQKIVLPIQILWNVEKNSKQRVHIELPPQLQVEEVATKKNVVKRLSAFPNHLVVVTSDGGTASKAHD